MSNAADAGLHAAHASPTRRPAPAARVLRMFVILVVVLAAGYAVQATSEAPHQQRFVWLTAAILAGSSIALAVAAKLVWGMRAPVLVRGALVAVLAYHALFGPAMLLHMIRASSNSNDDIVQRIWPHVVHAIDSLE